MISQETLKKIKQIEIHTRRLLNGALVGDKRSAIKGSGFEFDQIREYQPGDDVRFIDWKSSARMHKLLVKQYIEERSRCIIVVLDASSSGMFTTANRTKYEVMAEIAAMLSLVAEYGDDSFSLLLFSSTLDLVVPPNKGRHHVQNIMAHIFEHIPKKASTSFMVPLEYLARMQRKDALVVFISDFIDIQSQEGIERVLHGITKKSEMIAIRCLDDYEKSLPQIGFLTVEDIETGDRAVLDTRTFKKLSSFLHDQQVEQERLFKKYGIDMLDVSPHKPFVTEVIQFFRKRVTY